MPEAISRYPVLEFSTEQFAHPGQGRERMTLVSLFLEVIGDHSFPIIFVFLLLRIGIMFTVPVLFWCFSL